MLDSQINECREYLFNKLLKQWLEHGIHPELGYSYESLNHDWSVNPLGRIRLLTQCRQLYTFSHAFIETDDKQWHRPLNKLFEFIISNYWKNDAWIFSLDDHLNVKETQSDCYALAFVLLAFSYYFKASGDKRALEFIESTHLFLQNKMASVNGGFLESYPPSNEHIRRQNPHMHLLEGYLAVFSIQPTQIYKTEIKKLLDLLTSHFYDESSESLIEFFEEDWKIHPSLGDNIEPGHHFEWVWLLHQANRIFSETRYLKIADALWESSVKHGFDPQGGIYNKVHSYNHTVIDAEKRIWPITEYLKALCAHQSTSKTFQQDLSNSLQFLLCHYLKKDGSWYEYLDASNHPKQHALPGTTSYHLFLGLLEVLKRVKANIK